MYCAYLLCTRPNGKQLCIFLFNLDDNSINMKLLNCNFKIQKLKTELFVTFMLAKAIIT